ncbi:MAG: hypothetical protein V9G25_03725 [Acidimicrobiia bacterium]
MLAGNAQDNTKATEISKVYGLMRELLVHDLEPEKFADMYAQTLFMVCLLRVITMTAQKLFL